ncbi:hypothetical protein H9649_07600 [Sporosarcina sp. Sa2YVA2]|uniref:Uncharacterized protein n=1 Tax=Sporosarcina quadrami TaxID=2762234 RepID=A0ABR8U9N5_9BACL|nr:hypothetical protein [Sporosarcina quadrami]MBD7984439.1 hypothetical protein [Sporosarcina quadrami]
MNLYDEMNDAIKYSEPFLAYTIFWAIQKGHVTRDSNFDDLKKVELNLAEIRELQSMNLLGVDNIKLYAAKHGEVFSFIFAESETAARAFYYSEYGKFPEGVTDASKRMDVSMLSKDEGHMTFRQMRDREINFPSLACHYKKGIMKEEVREEYQDAFS